MENQRHAQNQGLFDALESLSAALSVVSLSVDMVREELQSVLSMLADDPTTEAAAPVSVASVSVADENSSVPVVERSVGGRPVGESAPAIYLLNCLPDDVSVIAPETPSLHETERRECLTCAV